MTSSPAILTDEELTAYLDGEADDALVARVDAEIEANEAVVERLAALSAGLDVLKDAYALDSLAPPAYVPVAAPKETATNTRFALPLAVAASFALGAVAMQITRPAEPTWVDAVASYQALYVTETLSGTIQAPQITESVMETVVAALGVDLRGALEIPGLTFKRAQMLAIEGQPLVQMAYLDDQGRPFAFCAVLLGDADETILSEMSHGLAAASWVSDGVGFVLIGGEDLSGVTELSRGLRQTL